MRTTFALFALVLTAFSAPAAAQETAPEAPIHAFDREFAAAVYATGHAGSYLSGGLGVVHSMWSLFADLQANFYGGHDRTAEGWTGGVDEELTFFWNVQLNIGVQFHLGRR